MFDRTDVLWREETPTREPPAQPARDAEPTVDQARQVTPRPGAPDQCPRSTATDPDDQHNFDGAEVERDLISERTREGLARARASGRTLGRPKGSLGVSRLDGKEDDIRRFLELGVSKTAIAKITGVSRTSLYSFMRTRGLKPSP